VACCCCPVVQLQLRILSRRELRVPSECRPSPRALGLSTTTRRTPSHTRLRLAIENEMFPKCRLPPRCKNRETEKVELIGLATLYIARSQQQHTSHTPHTDGLELRYLSNTDAIVQVGTRASVASHCALAPVPTPPTPPCSLAGKHRARGSRGSRLSRPQPSVHAAPIQCTSSIPHTRWAHTHIHPHPLSRAHHRPLSPPLTGPAAMAGGHSARDDSRAPCRHSVPSCRAIACQRTPGSPAAAAPPTTSTTSTRSTRSG